MVNYEVHEISAGHIEVRLDGDLVLGPDGANVRGCLNPLAERFPELTVDLSRLRRIDSTGIGILVTAHAIADANGNRMRAVNVVGAVREVLLLVKLLAVLSGPSEIPTAA